MTHKLLTLSIVVPAYNEQDYLRACLEAIASQSVQPNEVIVVDNNSTDNTREIAKSFPFVRLLNESKQGVTHARDRGFNAARGDIICRIDSDTILPANWTKQIIEEFADKGTAAVTGPVSYYDMPFPKRNFMLNHIMCLYTCLMAPNSPFIFGTNMAIRRNVWLNVKNQVCHEDNIHEDIDLAIHLSEANYFISYTKRIMAHVSGRRYNDKPVAFAGYIRMFSRVYQRHNLFNVSMYLSMFLWFLGYCIMHPSRKLWQLAYGSTGHKYPLSTEGRKNPMSVNL